MLQIGQETSVIVQTASQKNYIYCNASGVEKEVNMLVFVNRVYCQILLMLHNGNQISVNP